MLFDLKILKTTIEQIEAEKKIPAAVLWDAIEQSLAAAYKKDHGKRGQVIRAKLDQDTGSVTFTQVNTVVDENSVRPALTEEEMERLRANPELRDAEKAEEELKPRYDEEKHMFLDAAKLFKSNAQLGDEIIFPLETPEADFGRVAAQTAKQVIIQKIREAEKISVMGEYGEKEGQIVAGMVERVERGVVYIDMGRAVGVIPYEEQIPSEHWKTGDRIRAYLYAVEEGPKGIMLKLSRAHPQFLAKLFETETPEIASGVVEIKSIAREAGSRSKIAVISHDSHIDPIGSMVGQRGVRVATVTSELSGEKIDIIEWNEDPAIFIEEALSPAEVVSLELDEKEHKAIVTVTEDEQSLAIGKGGQNVRLAAKLTGWKIDIKSIKGLEDLVVPEDAENPEEK